ncbi:hypothetical protein PoB_005487400 [Plakobranchus ocellatus]|uniref:Uncharacterized protein n=1 Tax=Plakobranchus ocellatus TaxID=259542 RepID=A0AAV4C740_9GAST|nr:hypothetical protein PoB_005487400 [Plakobranchus ocellatus]
MLGDLYNNNGRLSVWFNVQVVLLSVRAKSETFIGFGSFGIEAFLRQCQQLLSLACPALALHLHLSSLTVFNCLLFALMLLEMSGPRRQAWKDKDYHTTMVTVMKRDTHQTLILPILSNRVHTHSADLRDISPVPCTWTFPKL